MRVCAHARVRMQVLVAMCVDAFIHTCIKGSEAFLNRLSPSGRHQDHVQFPDMIQDQLFQAGAPMSEVGRVLRENGGDEDSDRWKRKAWPVQVIPGLGENSSGVSSSLKFYLQKIWVVSCHLPVSIVSD